MVKCRELEVRTHPGITYLDHTQIQGELKEIRKFCEQHESYFFHKDECPDQAHCGQLLYEITQNSLSELEFMRFCKKNNLERSTESPKSAMRYLSYEFGWLVGEIYLNELVETTPAYQALISLAASSSFCLVDPDDDYCLLNVQGA